MKHFEPRRALARLKTKAGASPLRPVDNIGLFYMWGTASTSWDIFCILFVHFCICCMLETSSTRPLAGCESSGGSPAVFSHQVILYPPYFLLRGWQEKLRYRIQPLWRMSGGQTVQQYSFQSTDDPLNVSLDQPIFPFSLFKDLMVALISFLYLCVYWSTPESK